MTRARSRTDGVFVRGTRLALHDRDLLGEGGEGRVYRVGDLAAKIFTVEDARREDKLRAFPTQLPVRVVGPIDLCTNDHGAVIGFTMRAVEGATDLRQFSCRPWRDGRISNASLLHIFRDISETLERLHAAGIVVGDLNDGNVIVTPPPSDAGASAKDWTPWFIDADSMQFGSHATVVAHERFLDPRLYGVNLGAQAALSRESDWYALAVLLFGSLLYVHPYGGAHPAYPTMLRRAEARCSVLRGDVKFPSVAARPDILPDDALEWFVRVFERDVREPLPASLLEARFSRCSCGVEHARARCPVCAVRAQVAPVVRARGHIHATRVFTTRGRIVAAIMQGGLKHAHEADGVLSREDGSVVLQQGAAGEREARLARLYFDDPNRTVHLAGTATWVGLGGSRSRSPRMAKIIGGRIVEDLAVGRVGAVPSADASLDGLVHAHGDTLVRAESGTRVGQILEDQTYVRVGASLGFAFYRAGELTVAFVFDPRRGPLRQIEEFPRLRGKLLGWSAVFASGDADAKGDAQVLVSFATEDGGRTEHAAHLIDARGRLLATEAGGLSPLSQSLGGRAIAGGNVLVAGDDGLVLLHPDQKDRVFVPLRLLPEARDFAPPDAQLLVSPGGSLFVVTHDEITHLRFQ